MTTRDIVLIALFAALTAVMAIFPPITLPLIPVPITAQSLRVMLPGGVPGAAGRRLHRRRARLRSEGRALHVLGLSGRLLAAEAPRRALALMTAAFGTGQITGPLVAGVIADRTGDFTVPSLLAVLVLIVCAALVWPMRQQV